MEQTREAAKEKAKANWNIWIPVIVWIACVFLGIVKIFLRVYLFEKEGKIEVIDILNAFNSNTFSTFISVMACKLYLHFSTEKVGLERERISGLSMKKMPYILIITSTYVVVAVFDAAISLIGMAVIFLIFGLGYVFCFFRIFLRRNEGR